MQHLDYLNNYQACGIVLRCSQYEVCYYNKRNILFQFIVTCSQKNIYMGFIKVIYSQKVCTFTLLQHCNNYKPQNSFVKKKTALTKILHSGKEIYPTATMPRAEQQKTFSSFKGLRWSLKFSEHVYISAQRSRKIPKVFL